MAGALEEHHNTLIRNHSQLKLSLSRSQNQYEKQHKRYASLQSEYDQMAEQISEWAESHRSSSEALVKNIKYVFRVNKCLYGYFYFLGNKKKR